MSRFGSPAFVQFDETRARKKGINCDRKNSCTVQAEERVIDLIEYLFEYGPTNLWLVRQRNLFGKNISLIDYFLLSAKSRCDMREKIDIK